MKKPMRKTNKIAAFLILLAVGFLSAGFRFFEPEAKWPGKTAVVKYRVFLEAGMFPEEQKDWIFEIITAGKIWFRQAEAGVVLKPEAVAIASAYPLEYSPSCEQAMKMTAVFSSSGDDPDCTGSSCSFLWSCEADGKIMSASIQLNQHDYRWSIAPTPGFSNLKQEIIHNFGHVLGLNHCNAGEKNCALTSDGVMSKFVDGASLNLSDDNKDGLQTLYGKLSLPFPAEGRYALSEEEMNAVIDIMQYQNMTGADYSQVSFNNYVKDLASFSEEETGKSVETQMHEFFGQVLAGVDSAPLEHLQTLRKMNVMAIYLADLWQKAADSGTSTLDRNIINQSREYHEAIRRKIIDRSGGAQ